MAKLFWLNATQAAVELLLPHLGSGPCVDDHRVPDGIRR